MNTPSDQPYERTRDATGHDQPEQYETGRAEQRVQNRECPRRHLVAQHVAREDDAADGGNGKDENG